MKALVGTGSQMYYLTAALNGTIKNKLHASIKTLCNGPFCTPQELVAVQWAEAFLTTTTLMVDINLN